MIPVIFAINNTYVKQLATVIVSILKNNKSQSAYEFNILNTDISNENINILTNTVKKFSNDNSKINFIDMRKYTENVDLSKFMSIRDNYTYISIETYFRFFIPDIFQDYHKVIYLDADILVLDDLSELYGVDIKDYYAGVVQDNWQEYNILKNNPTDSNNHITYIDYYRNKLHKQNNQYFNAGILLLNLDLIRKDNITDNLWKFTIDESPLDFQDQDVLNAVLEPKLKYIDAKWNVLKDLGWFANQYDGQKQQECLNLYNNPGIFHYVGPNKPWLIHSESYNYNFIKDWWVYYQQTDYFNNSDNIIFKEILRLCLVNTYKNIFTCQIFNLKLLEIYQSDCKIHIRLFNNKIKTRIKLAIPDKNNISIKNI